ncbi:MAG: hypothetical protein AAGU19_21510 [Prolixibacteraceae bacterium]
MTGRELIPFIRHLHNWGLKQLKLEWLIGQECEVGAPSHKVMKTQAEPG